MRSPKMMAVLAAISAVGLVASGVAPATAVTDQDECLTEGIALLESYRIDNGLAADAPTYVSCLNGAPTVFGVAPDGEQLAPMTSEAGREAQKPTTQALEVDTYCDITGVYLLMCQFHPEYSKIDGETGTVEWTRWVTARANVSLQTFYHIVSQSYYSDEYINIGADGHLRLFRMQGILPPTLETSTSFNYDNDPPFNGAAGGGTIPRNDYTEGKYSVEFDLEGITDHSEGVRIPIIGGITSPRFQCYGEDPEGSWWPQCEYPNGEEAGIF